MIRANAVARRVAEDLLAAYRGAPLGTLGLDAETAHSVRDCALEIWSSDGRLPAGRKIGLTSQAVREKLGAPEPSDGFLFADMRVADGGIVVTSSLHAPLVEAELAILIGRDIEHPGADPEDLLDAVDGACAAIEIADTRIADWAITYADAIADNGSAALFVRSDTVRAFSAQARFSWRTYVSGRPDLGQSGTRDAAGILHDLHWLAVKAARTGRPLRAGEIVLTGALAGAMPVTGETDFTVSVGGFGDCAVSFRGDTAPILAAGGVEPSMAPERQ